MTMPSKQEIRSAIRLRKRAMTPDQIDCASRKLGALLRESELYQTAKTVYFYLPCNQEVRTIPMIRQAFADGKAVAVPKCYGAQMRFITIESLEGIAPGSYGIPEPVADGPIADDKTALVLMPGLAFDRAGHRIGYGGGYYDRFLAQEPDHPTLALCYGFQMVDHLDTEIFDIPVDQVIWADPDEE